MMQFKRLANVYFLIVCILAFMPFSPKNPLGLAAAFVLVLLLTMFKEGYEDYFRHRSDREVNTRKVAMVDDDWTEQVVEWRRVKVGDILKVKENEPLPADLFLLKSSMPSGLCFVNTMNLDGETNLKEKFAPDCTKDCDIGTDFRSFTLQVDEPNSNLHNWNCNVEVEGRVVPVTPQQLLMRGCLLKNTDYIYGVVVYTGHDSKIIMNSKKPPQKTSNIMLMMNRVLVSVFVLEACICFGFAAASVDWNGSNASDHEYLDLDSKTSGGFFFIKALTYLVAYSHLIPISLYVTLEILKLILARFINSDLNMYDEAADRTAISRTSELIEELGEIEIIFSDKTGTLTANIMEFKLCFIDDVVYSAEDQGDHSEVAYLYAEHSKLTPSVTEFFRLMAVCNSVFPTRDKDQVIHYQATSPDELALVDASNKGGFVLLNKESNTLEVLEEARGKTFHWKILAEIPFSSKRGCMSVIVQHPETGAEVVLSKGSDAKMLKLLVSGPYSQLHHNLDLFARQGLRTLVMASRTLDHKFYESWIKRWTAVLATNDDAKADNLSDLAEEVENELELVGASAIDDKLQDEVPETIKMIIEGGIRLWVLTGDKQETAIEIGKSCNLIQEGMTLSVLSSTSLEMFNASFDRLAAIANDPEAPALINCALVIDGPTLAFALEKGKEFFDVAKRCKSCICCRVSPINKSQVVALARKHSDWITLAIGDGANDVSMIQTAHVGLGIIGKEGTQAVQASDYAIAQFKFLRHLLFFHGRLGYKRVSWFICYYIYKNFVLVFTELGFAFMNGFSGQIYFLDLLPQLFNSMWTSWPCLVGFSTDRDVATPEECFRHTWLYAAGQQGIYFNLKVFWTWILMAVSHGLICFLVPMYEFSLVAKDSDGLDSGLWVVSTVSFVLVIHIVTLKIILETTMWFWQSM
jgi:phospholipid-transporting ATPase